MADLNVNIGGDASGAIAACAAAQAAIDGVNGKTVVIDIETRGGGVGGRSGGVGGVASDLNRVGDAADRAGRSARGMGEDLGRSAGHMGRMADDAERLRDHLASVDRILSGGAPSSTGRTAAGMRSLADNADQARQSISGIGSESSRSLGAVEAGAIRAGGGMRQLGAGAGSASQFMSDMGGTAQRVSRDLVPMAQGADGVYRSVSRMSEAGKDVEKFAGSMRTIDAVGRVLGEAGGAAAGGGLGGLLAGIGSDLTGLASGAGPAMAAIKGIGIAGGVSAIGMGALGAAVAGVGLAGVAEDFAHNNQLMNAGQDAVRGFNKEFSRMQSATSAAGMPAMDGLASSIKGVGHELAQIGADNMAPTLNMASQLAGSATQAMHQLAPAIGPAEQAMTALGGAALGAFGQSAPQIASFANAVTQNSAGIQSGLTSTVSLMANLGTMTAQALGTAAPLIQGASTIAGGIADIVSGASGIPSNNTAVPNADGSRPGGASTANRFGGALGGAASVGLAGAGIGAAVGSFVPILGTAAGAVVGGTIGAVAGGVGGFLDAGEKGDQAQKLGPLEYHPQSYYTGARGGSTGRGNFGPGSGGPTLPAGTSPTAASGALTQARADAGLPPVGQPHYSGVGPRGPGSAVGAMPASIASGLGLAGGSAMPSLMSSMQSAVTGGGGGLAQATQQHIQKAVHTAGPAATAGGASLGAAMTGGMAQGVTSTQTVTDTVLIKHAKRMIDVSAGALGVRSPSTEYDYLGRMTSQGFGQGVERDSHHAVNAVTGMFGQMGSKFSPDYAGTSGPTISIRKASSTRANYDDPAAAQQAAANPMGARFQGMQNVSDAAAGPEAAQDPGVGSRQSMYKPGSAEWWGAHNNRAAQLAFDRDQRHQAALNLGDPAWAFKQARDTNPFQQLGMNSAAGIAQGYAQRQAQVEQAGGSLATAGQTGYRKKDKQNSPSAVWAEMGGNSVAGIPIGFAAGVPAAVSAMSNSAGTMADVVGGYLSDRGLMAGYTWGESIVTGASMQLKKSDYTSAGLPSQLKNSPAMAALAKTGFLSAGSGASIWKTAGNTPSIVTLAPASPAQPTPVTVEAHFHLEDQVTTIARTVMLDAVDRLTDRISGAPR